MTEKSPNYIFTDFNVLINFNNSHLTKWFSDLFFCMDVAMSEGKLFYSKGDFWWSNSHCILKYYSAAVLPLLQLQELWAPHAATTAMHCWILNTEILQLLNAMFSRSTISLTPNLFCTSHTISQPQRTLCHLSSPCHGSGPPKIYRKNCMLLKSCRKTKSLKSKWIF